VSIAAVAEDRLKADVIIIGAGGAGVSAAIEASRAGASVVLVEQADQLGGTAAIAGGGSCMVCTPLQESNGIHDTPDLAFRDWVECGEGDADEAWARYFIEHSRHDLYLWTESLGVKWQDVSLRSGDSVARYHQPLNNGQGVMTALINGLHAQGGTKPLTGHVIEKLLINDRRICGVLARNIKTGKSLEVRSRTVIVATGGFNANLDMVLDAKPDLKAFKVLIGGGPNAKGQGHGLLRDIGACFTNLQNIIFYVYATPDYRDLDGARGLVFRQTPGYVWVNQQGRRFHDESRYEPGESTPPLLAQNPPHAWAILDHPMTLNMQVSGRYYNEGGRIFRDKVEELLDNSPYIHKADTIEALARQIDVDVPTFVSEIAQYNQAFDAGLEREPRFGKPLELSKKFDTPPYRAIKLLPLARKNLGGVKTDLQCRVVDQNRKIIPGLYAAGEVAGMAGGHISGKSALDGTMLGPSIFSGRVSGGWAAHEAGFGPGFIGKAHRPD
jgi:flavocytochrome c